VSPFERISESSLLPGRRALEVV